MPIRIALLVAAGCALVAVVVAIGVLSRSPDQTKTWAGTADPAHKEVVEAPEPAPEPEPEPPPPPPPPPVEGQVDRTGIVDLSTANTGVFQPGSDPDQPVPVDHDAVDTFVAAAASWLDAHLQAYRDGQPLDLPGMTGDPAAVTAAIVGSADDLDRVHYAVRVGARGAPEWAEVSVHIGYPDGPTAGVVTFVTAEDPGHAVPVAMEALRAPPGDGDRPDAAPDTAPDTGAGS